MTTVEEMNSARNIARIAGLLYLIVAIGGAFAFAFVLAKVYFPGDAATTAANVQANSGLVRTGVVADLLQATVFAFLGMALYRLLKHVNKNAAGSMMILVAIATTIMCLNLVFQFAALLVATDASYVTAFGASGSNALVLLLLDMHHYGFLIAQNLLRPVAGAPGVSRLQIVDVPKGAGHRAHRGRRLLPVRLAREVPGPRLRRHSVRFPGYRAHYRGELDGRIPARERCEGARPGHHGLGSRESRTSVGRCASVASMCQGLPLLIGAPLTPSSIMAMRHLQRPEGL